MASAVAQGRGASRRRALGSRAVFLGPGLVYVTAFMTIPILLVVSYAFLTRGRFGGVEFPVTLENFVRALDPIYLRVQLDLHRICNNPAGAIDRLPDGLRHHQAAGEMAHGGTGPRGASVLDQLLDPNLCVDRALEFTGPGKQNFGKFGLD